MTDFPHLRLNPPIVLEGPIEFEPELEPENQSYYYPNPDEPAESYFIAVLDQKRGTGKQYRVFDPMRRFIYASTLRSDAEQYVKNHIKNKNAGFKLTSLKEWFEAQVPA